MNTYTQTQLRNYLEGTLSEKERRAIELDAVTDELLAEEIELLRTQKNTDHFFEERILPNLNKQFLNPGSTTFQPSREALVAYVRGTLTLDQDAKIDEAALTDPDLSKEISLLLDFHQKGTLDSYLARTETTAQKVIPEETETPVFSIGRAVYRYAAVLTLLFVGGLALFSSDLIKSDDSITTLGVEGSGSIALKQQVQRDFDRLQKNLELRQRPEDLTAFRALFAPKVELIGRKETLSDRPEEIFERYPKATFTVKGVNEKGEITVLQITELVNMIIQ
ncbi:MAG: hypothetical protein AAF740_07975 [Bacteroidota bacterium]